MKNNFCFKEEFEEVLAPYAHIEELLASLELNLNKAQNVRVLAQKMPFRAQVSDRVGDFALEDSKGRRFNFFLADAGKLEGQSLITQIIKVAEQIKIKNLSMRLSEPRKIEGEKDTYLIKFYQKYSDEKLGEIYLVVSADTQKTEYKFCSLTQFYRKKKRLEIKSEAIFIDLNSKSEFSLRKNIVWFLEVNESIFQTNLNFTRGEIIMSVNTETSLSKAGKKEEFSTSQDLVPVRLHLGDIEISTEQLLGLRPGQVIALGFSAPIIAALEVEGVCWGTAALNLQGEEIILTISSLNETF